MKKILFILSLLIISTIFLSGCVASTDDTQNNNYTAPPATEPTNEGCGSTTTTNKSNYDCLIMAAETCTPAKLTDLTTINMFGLLVSTSTQFEIKGLEAGKCVFYQKTLDQSIVLSDEIKQQLVDSGKTAAEIQTAETEANANAKQNAGLELTCKFNISDLTTTLTNWKNGEASSHDYDVAECN